MANGHGGRRQGAGRKPKCEKYASKIARAEKILADALPELAEKAVALARGVKVLDAEGEEAYLAPPDLKALVYCFNRILGRPTIEATPPPAVEDPGSDDFVLDLSGGPDPDANDPPGEGDGPPA